MAFLDDISNQLSTQSLASSSGVGGYVLTRNWLPDSTALQDQVVALIETAGLAPDPRNQLDDPGLQVLVRGPSLIKATSAFVDAQAKAQAIKSGLHALTFTSSSGRYYPGIRAQQDPFLLHVDENKRPVYACNYLAWRSRT